MKLSIVVPTLDEAAGISDALKRLAPLREAGHEVIVVDGGSGDRTLDIAMFRRRSFRGTFIESIMLIRCEVKRPEWYAHARKIKSAPSNARMATMGT